MALTIVCDATMVFVLKSSIYKASDVVLKLLIVTKGSVMLQMQ